MKHCVQRIKCSASEIKFYNEKFIYGKLSLQKKRFGNWGEESFIPTGMRKKVFFFLFFMRW